LSPMAKAVGGTFPRSGWVCHLCGTRVPVQGKIEMAGLYTVRKVCPGCGGTMKALLDEATEERLRYVCAKCDDDPLLDPTARKWADGPLRPPEK
jgi:ribosomal protein S27AE